MTDTKGSHDRSNHGDHHQSHHPPRGSTLPTRQCTTCWWFLPGGHVEPGEGVEALVRETSEEIGTESKITGFVGVVEHGYREDGVTHHELNLGFEVAITEPDPDPVSQEHHLEFHWLPFDQLPDTDVRPRALKHALLATGDDRTPFWHS